MTDKLNGDICYEYVNRVNSFKKDLEKIIKTKPAFNTPTLTKSPTVDSIYESLSKVSMQLAKSYHQVKSDLDDSTRISWSGTSHEIREIVTNLLRLLAPDDDLVLTSWYKKEKDTSGPTQKQRVKYILQKQSAGSKKLDLTEHVSRLDGLIEDLVRDTYTRASDAAHRAKDRTEAKRLLRYFDAFAHDLLDLR